MALIDEQAAAASAVGGPLMPNDEIQVAGVGQAAGRLGQTILEKATGKGGAIMGEARDKLPCKCARRLKSPTYK